MTKRLGLRVITLVLSLAVLVSVASVISYHGEWWFPLLERLRVYRAPELSAVEVDWEERQLNAEFLPILNGVEYSQTLMLVNAEHPLPADYAPLLIEYNGARMHPWMKDPYVALRDDVQAATGVRIYVASDFRTREEQEEIIASSDAGIAAPLGCSEHEAGLALDVYAPYYGGENFLRSPAGRMVNRICADYGYILRYPVGRESVTGIAYEPWHLRYVGAPHARLMTDSGLTLEEYVELFEVGQWYRSGDYLIARLAPDDLSVPATCQSCEISPDNTGFYLVTVKM